jgi:predicted transcriptional regulator
MTDTTSPTQFIALTADIVSAYVSNNTVPASDIPNLINQVHLALLRVSSASKTAKNLSRSSGTSAPSTT